MNCKKRKTYLSALLAALALPWALPHGGGAAEAEKAGKFERMELGAGIKAVEIAASGDVSIKLGVSGGGLEVAGLKYENAEGYPVSAATEGGTVTLTIAGKKPGLFSGPDKLKAEMSLLIPPGLSVKISGGTLGLSGNISASDLDISGGSLRAEDLAMTVPGRIRLNGGLLRLNASIAGSSDIKISGGAVSGKLRAPCSAKIDSGRSRPDLKLYCTPEGK